MAIPQFCIVRWLLCCSPCHTTNVLCMYVADVCIRLLICRCTPLYADPSPKAIALA